MTTEFVIRESFEDLVDPAHTALVVIDVQNDLCSEDSRTIVPRLARLVDTARDAGAYVVYIQQTALPDGQSNAPAQIARRRKLGMKPDVTIDGTWGHRFVDGIVPRADEPVVRKHRMSAFLGTNLEQLLRCRRVETVVCTGIATNGCVLNTAYAALGLDYYVVVVEDCIATSQPAFHRPALDLLRGSMHDVVEADRLIAAWRSVAVACGATFAKKGEVRSARTAPGVGRAPA